MFDFSFAVSIFPQLAVAALTTLFVTVASFLFALIVGIPLLLLRRSRWQVVSQATTAAVDFIRCTPILVQLYFLYFAMPEFGVRLSPLATGLLVFSVHYGCYMSEVYRAGLEAVPRGQWDACVALSYRAWRLTGRSCCRRCFIRSFPPRVTISCICSRRRRYLLPFLSSR
jgi:polar amino acid transport system permease protein